MRRAGNDSGLSAQSYIASIDGGVPSLCSRPVHAVRDDTGASWPVTPPDVLRADQHVNFSLLPHLVVPFHLQDETPFLL